MRKAAIISSAVAVAAGAITVGGLATASANRPSPAVMTTTRAFVEHAETDTVVDIGKKGDSRGDQLAFSNPVFGPHNRTQVGHDLGSCIRTRPGVSWECSWTLVLAHGSLVVQGPFLDAGDSTLAITGGTGRYAQARGQMRLHALNAAGSSYRFIYRITK